MTESTVQHLFRSLEQTVRERLDGIRELIEQGQRPLPPLFPQHTSFPEMNRTYVPCPDTMMFLQKIHGLEDSVKALREEVACLRASKGSDLLPTNPMDGIEVIPKREVVLADTEPLSFANRLLLNSKARKALEAEEMGEARTDVYPLTEEVEEVEEEAAEEEAAEEEAEAEEAVEEEDEEEAEEEAAEEEAVDEDAEEEAAEEEEEEAAEELEEFEYKGSTYYRDGQGQVYMTDEDGELVSDPIGTWNPVKQRIVMIKSTA